MIALVLAVPISLLAALFLTEYVSPALRGPLVTVVDLLAAVPSLIYGIWGFFFLQPHLMGVSAWLAAQPRLHPAFSTRRRAPTLGLSPFLAGVVVALMLTADRDRGHARGVLADAAGREGGRAGARRQPLAA